MGNFAWDFSVSGYFGQCWQAVTLLVFRICLLLLKCTIWYDPVLLNLFVCTILEQHLLRNCLSIAVLCLFIVNGTTSLVWSIETCWHNGSLAGGNGIANVNKLALRRAGLLLSLVTVLQCTALLCNCTPKANSASCLWWDVKWVLVRGHWQWYLAGKVTVGLVLHHWLWYIHPTGSLAWAVWVLGL